MKNPLIQLGVAMLLLVVVLGGYGFWYAQVGEKSTELGTITQQINDQALASTRVAQAKTELESLSNDKASIEQYFISTDNVVPFLESLQSTGTYLHTNVQVVSVSAEQGKPFGKLDLSLKIDGTYGAVARTLGAIEYGPYDTHIVSLTLNSDGGGSATTAAGWTAEAEFTVGTIPADSSAPTATTDSSTQSTPAASPTPVSSSRAPVSATQSSGATASQSSTTAPVPVPSGTSSGASPVI